MSLRITPDPSPNQWAPQTPPDRPAAPGPNHPAHARNAAQGRPDGLGSRPPRPTRAPPAVPPHSYEFETNPVIVQQNRTRRVLDTAARAQDNGTGLGVFRAASHALMAAEAPRLQRLAALATKEGQSGIVTVYGNNTPAQSIHGFEPKP